MFSLDHEQAAGAGQVLLEVCDLARERAGLTLDEVLDMVRRNGRT